MVATKFQHSQYLPQITLYGPRGYKYPKGLPRPAVESAML